jgi:hypothetical protein
MKSQEQIDAGLEFYRNTLHLAGVLVELVRDYDAPYEDQAIIEIIEGDEYFRRYHPVSLFSAIQFIDELAQIIKPKRIAEMDEEVAWVWEMRRIFELLINQSYQSHPSDNKLLFSMAKRLVVILNEERRKYES